MQVGVTSYRVDVSASAGVVPALYVGTGLPTAASYQNSDSSGGSSVMLTLSAEDGEIATLGT